MRDILPSIIDQIDDNAKLKVLSDQESQQIEQIADDDIPQLIEETFEEIANKD